MKNKVILLLIVFFSTVVNAQIVDIPDPNFKNALVNTLCVASEYQGDPAWDADVNNDGEIQVSEAEAVVHLVISGQNIASLEGIETFTGLKSLFCGGNQISDLEMSNSPNLEYLNCNSNGLESLIVSQNTNLIKLSFLNNNIQSLDVTQNTNLEELICYNNLIQNLDLSQNTNLYYLQASNNQLSSLDITQNINLVSCSLAHNFINEIDLSQNINLLGFGINDNNITALDVSNNPELKLLTCHNNPLTGELDLSHLNGGMYALMCNNTLLSSLNIKNGDNVNLTRMWAQDNPNLTCIQVDDVDYANSQFCQSSSGWCKDETTIYSEDCNLGIEDNLPSQLTIYPNPTKGFIHIESNHTINSIKVFDVLGKLVFQENNQVNQIDISSLDHGLFFVKIETDQGISTQKVLKQ